MSRDLILVALSLLTWGIGEGAFYHFQPLYLQQLGATPIEIGAILGGLGFAMTIAHIPAGYLADRIGRRGLMWAAWFCGLAAAWIMALARTLPVFVIGMMLYGLTAFVMSPLNSYITAAKGKWSVGRAITLVQALYNAGAIAGPLLGGYIGKNFGLQKIYLLSGITFVISTLLILFIQPQAVEYREHRSERVLFTNRPYLIYLSVIFLAVFTMYLPQPLTPNFLQNQRALDVSKIGLLGSINNLGNVVLIFGLGFLNSQTGFLLGQAAVGLYALLLWRGGTLPWYAIGYFLLGGYRASRALAVAQVRSLISSANMGLAYGMIETVSGIAIILAPPLAGLLYERSPIMIYPTAFALIVISLFAGIVYTKNKRIGFETV
jgi:DHA1 family multidrug resistance protein-like MFS transporter